MKRIISLFMAIMLILSVGAVSISSANTEETIENTEAVSVLTALNIMSYYEDGTFRPEETVTRAETVAIICRMLNYEEFARSSMGERTVFNDVPADHWASGYVNIAQAQGIINGYGDFNFGPEDKVTYEQVVKMIVATLGGDLLAARQGGYPEGYLKVAFEEGVLRNTECNVGDTINRETVATLVFNALEVNLIGFGCVWGGTYADRDIYGAKLDDTILSKHWEIRKWSGVLKKEKTNFVLKDAECFEYKDNKLTKVEETLGEVDFSRIDNIEDLEGQEVNAYISEDADKTTKKHIAYAVVKK